MTFKNYNLKPYINEALAEINFVEPTKVQEIVIPKVLKEKKLRFKVLLVVEKLMLS